MDLKKYLYTINIVNENKKVSSVDVQFIAQDIGEGGTMHMTDLMFQEGDQVTAHQISTKETLIPVSFDIDEFTFMDTVSNAVKDGAVQPTIHTGVKNRFYNFVGRGHQALAIPNVYNEDYTQQLVTTALDLTFYAKEDFDLLRVSTNNGALVPGRRYDEDTLTGYDVPNVPGIKYPKWIDLYPNGHPLNYRYTREFYFDGASAGQEIDLHASIKTAVLNGVNIPFSQGNILLNGQNFYVERQRLMGAPFGSFRVRLEFYKQASFTYVDPMTGNTKQFSYLKDAGVGFWGLAEFRQYSQERGVL